MIENLYRFQCDHCHRPLGGVHSSAVEARASADMGGRAWTIHGNYGLKGEYCSDECRDIHDPTGIKGRPHP